MGNWLNEAEVETKEQREEKQREATRNRLTGAVQRHLDETAQERGYEGILSLASYATDPDSHFKAEGQAGVEWRGKVWRKGYAVLAAVESGQRAIPTEDELMAELPPMKWPTG